MRDWLITFRLYWTKVRYISVQFVYASIVKPSVSVAKEQAVKYWKYNWQKHHNNSAYTSIPSRFVVVSESQFSGKDILVTGAGSAFVNGIYYYNATSGTYYSTSGYQMYFLAQFTSWYIASPDNTVQYYALPKAQNPQYPSNIGQWPNSGISNGVAPAPLVEAYSAPISESVPVGKFHPKTSSTISGNLPPKP